MMARFVTVDTIDFKLHTYIPLGDRYSETESRPHMIPGLATRGRYVKIEKVQ